MSNYAVEALGEALRKTKMFFLQPFSLKKWLKLGLVGMFGGVLQQGSSPNCNSSSNSGGGSGGSSSGGDFANDAKEALDSVMNFWQEHTLLIAVLGTFIILLVAGISLVFSYIRACMFIIFIDSLVKKDVSIMKSFYENKNKSFSFFLFRAVIGLVAFVLIVILSFPLILSLWNMVQAGNLNIWLLVSGSLLTVISIVVIALVLHLIFSPTHDFAVPILYLKDEGIFGAWSDLVQLIRAKPVEFFVYYIIKVAIAMGTGLVLVVPTLLLVLVLLLVYVILAIPIIIFVVISIMLYAANPVLGIIAGIIGIIVGLLMSVVMILASFLFFCLFLPLHVFYRFYALTFLEKFDAGFNFSEAYTEIPSGKDYEVVNEEPISSEEEIESVADEAGKDDDYTYDPGGKTIFPEEGY